MAYYECVTQARLITHRPLMLTDCRVPGGSMPYSRVVMMMIAFGSTICLTNTSQAQRQYVTVTILKDFTYPSFLAQAQWKGRGDCTNRTGYTSWLVDQPNSAPRAVEATCADAGGTEFYYMYVFQATGGPPLQPSMPACVQSGMGAPCEQVQTSTCVWTSGGAVCQVTAN